MTTSLRSRGDATVGTGIDDSSPAMRLNVDPAFRLEFRETRRDLPARRLWSARNILLAVTALFALVGAVGAAFTLSPSNTPSESSMASLTIPSAPTLSRDQQEIPATDVGASAPLAPVPAAVRPSDAAPPPAVKNAGVEKTPPPLREAAAIQPRRQQPRHPAPTAQQELCTDCPPIDAAELPPLGPVARPN